jgi:lipoprotein-releasing system permease protein
VGGLTLGVAALILSLAAVAGFQQALRREVLARTPQLELVLPPSSDFDATVGKLEAQPDVVRVLRTSRGRAWLLSGRAVLPVEVVGSEPGYPAWFSGAPEDQRGLVISERAAARLGLEAGEFATLVSPVPGLTPLGPQPRSRSVAYVGNYVSGRSDPEERAAVPFAIADRLLGPQARRIEVETRDLDVARSLAARLREEFPSATVQSWEELNRPLFFALRLERTVMFVAVGLIVLVAALALVSDLSLIIANKRSEIGILGALGSPSSQVRALFAWLGGTIAAAGIGLGTLIGVGGAIALDATRSLKLPGGGFFLDYVPFRVEAADVLVVILVAGLLSWGFCAGAAGAAARLRPVEALRH